MKKKEKEKWNKYNQIQNPVDLLRKITVNKKNNKTKRNSVKTQ